MSERPESSSGFALVIAALVTSVGTIVAAYLTGRLTIQGQTLELRNEREVNSRLKSELDRLSTQPSVQANRNLTQELQQERNTTAELKAKIERLTADNEALQQQNLKRKGEQSPAGQPAEQPATHIPQASVPLSSDSRAKRVGQLDVALNDCSPDPDGVVCQVAVTNLAEDRNYCLITIPGQTGMTARSRPSTRKVKSLMLLR